MCYKILTNKSSIPPSYFISHPSLSPRLHHDKALFIPLVKTNSFKSSFKSSFFFVDVIPLWNSLPSNFVSCPSVSNFKRNIRSHFFTSFWQPIALFLCSCILMFLLETQFVFFCLGRHSYQLFSYLVNPYATCIKIFIQKKKPTTTTKKTFEESKKLE